MQLKYEYDPDGIGVVPCAKLKPGENFGLPVYKVLHPVTPATLEGVLTAIYI